MTRLIVSLAAVAALSSCACLTKFGVNRMAGTFENMGKSAQRENDPELLRIAAPSNMLMLDGMLEISPENRTLLVIAAQTYCSYAQGFVEETDPERAVMLYAKGRDYAMRALRTDGDFDDAIKAGERPEEAAKELGKKYVPAMFWAGSCLGGWMSLNKRDPKALLALPTIRGLMERVRDLDDTYFNGGVHMFFGIYYAGLPPMAGGGAEKSRESFEKSFAMNGGSTITMGTNLLPHVMFAQYYATLIQDRDLYETTLKLVLETPSDKSPDNTLVNVIAQKKAARLLKDIDRKF